MRQLHYIPIIHSQSDMGAMADRVRRLGIRTLGIAGWKRSVQSIELLWEQIRNDLDSVTVDPAKTRLYQDGLPVCGHEEAIVADLARARSPNHRLLVELMKRGAILMGTESAELLLEEYALARKVLDAGSQAEAVLARKQQTDVAAELLEKRDHFIAKRIDETLKDGETGILFLGMLHAIEPWLADDIELRYMVYAPSF